MSDLDDELLAMAGDESEGENEEAVSDTGGHSASPSQVAARSPTPENSPPRPSTETSKQPTRRGMAQKSTVKGGAKRRKVDESEEEGEASSAASSPQSLGSGAMDESDSDTSPGDSGHAVDSGSLYPLEGKYRDAKDKAYILSMTQLEQEAILAERAEEAESKKREMLLKNLVDTKDREAEKSKKRKAGAADLEDVGRKSTRPKTKRGEALDAYTRQREAAREDGRRRASNRTVRRSRTRSDRSHSSQLDADGESDDDYARGNMRRPEPEIPVDLVDVERIRVGRSRLAKYCFFPRFDETMTGCFSRVCIGQDKAGINTYRMAQIKGFKAGKPYLVDASPTVPPFYTDQYIILAHGKSEKDWPLTHCSDSKLTEAEFERWKKQLEFDSLRMTIKAETAKQCTKISELLDHHLTGPEINEKLEKQNKYKHLFTPAQPSLKQTNSNDMQHKLRLLNEKNRKQNAEDVRKALIAEKNRQRQAIARARREAVAAAAAKQNSLAVPKSDLDALFSEGSDISRTASPAPPVKEETPKKKGIPTFTKMTLDDDIIGSMDLGIDIEI